jgi:hypothetical protein
MNFVDRHCANSISVSAALLDVELSRIRSVRPQQAERGAEWGNIKLGQAGQR